MKKFLFLLSLLSLVTATQMNAQSDICKKICPVKCCVSAASADATATANLETANTEAKAVQTAVTTSDATATTPCCSPALQKVCKALGLACGTGNASATNTKLAEAKMTSCQKTTSDKKNCCKKMALATDEL